MEDTNTTTTIFDSITPVPPFSNPFTTLTNPFLIDIEDKPEYTNDELVAIQSQLHKKDTKPLIDFLYPKNQRFNTPYELIYKRCNKIAEMKIIDVENNVFPTKQLMKIGDGGNGKNCIVCFTHCSNDRCHTSQNIHVSLEEVGFNGYFYLMNGGFPNPTGTEMKYAGVPYCFKVFMMLEARKMGFEKVIWIDSACYAVNNPQKLFDNLSNDHVVFRTFPPGLFETYDNTVFPETLELLNRITDKDIRRDENICSIVFGLDFSLPLMDDFIAEYYDMVKLGLPFLSYFPEEVVYTVILNRPKYKHLVMNKNWHDNEKLFMHEVYLNKQQAKDHGYYFQQRIYK